MAQVFSPNVIEIAVVQTHAARPVVNVWHMYFDEELGTDTPSDVVRDFANNWQDHVLELQSNDVSLVRFDWRSIDPGSGALGTLAPDPAKDVNGVAVGAGMPPNVAYLVKKNTTDRQRGQRDGRSFLAGVVEAEVASNGTLNSTTRAAWQGQLDSFYSGITDISGGAAGDRYPVVLATTAASRAPGSTPVTIDSRRVTSLTLDTLVSTQRDRLR